MPEVHAAEVVIIGLGINLTVLRLTLIFLGRQLGLDFVGNAIRDVLLKRHNFARVAVVGFGPQVTV